MNNKTTIRDSGSVQEKCNRGFFIRAFGMLLAAWLPLTAGAVGFRMPNQDPEGIARGNAEAATADNPSAIYYNPAGITQLEGFQVRAGLYVISADSKFTSASGGNYETDASLQGVPQLYTTWSPK